MKYLALITVPVVIEGKTIHDCLLAKEKAAQALNMVQQQKTETFSWKTTQVSVITFVEVKKDTAIPWFLKTKKATKAKKKS